MRELSPPAEANDMELATTKEVRPLARKPKRDLTMEEQLARGPWISPS